MPTLKDLLDAIRELRVVPPEIKLPRRLFGDLLGRAEEIAEDENPEEEE